MDNEKDRLRAYVKETFQIEYTGFTRQDGKCAIVFLFPYYVLHDPEGNLSLYTYSLDYHQIITEILHKIITHLTKTYGDQNYQPYADISPFHEKKLAQQAGLGFIGRNSLLINEKYGSFVFIGLILCDLPFSPDPPNTDTCQNCGKCVAACPSGALNDSDFSKCLSALTQKKQELTPEETDLLQHHSLVFGCDICQLVCPHNHFLTTPLSDFHRALKTTLSQEDLDNLSNAQFREKFGDRAFSWRGKKVLQRNLALTRSSSTADDPPKSDRRR